MARTLKVAMLADEAWIPPDDPQFEHNVQATQTERHVAVALRDLGHSVRVVGVGTDLPRLVADLAADPPELAFNLVEQFFGHRRLAVNVTGLLELLEIPYTGAGPVAMMLCHDKGLCKKLLSLHRIRSPRFVLLPPGRPIRLPRSLRFPLIVKPQFEEGSEGIVKSSVVANPDELAERVRIIHERMAMDALAEEFVDGREIYVGVLGNERLTVLPPRELVFGRPGEGGPVIATSRVKHDDDYRDKWKIDYIFAEVEEALARRIDRLARTAYRVLQLAGYARLDLRIAPEGAISVLEVNANPDIAYGEDFAEAAQKTGLNYNALISRIIALGLAR